MRPGEPPRRKLTRVAVGVLVRRDGRVLLADRPAGKPYAGYWEFPGGKIEPGEGVADALRRELHEELGIDIGPSAPWVTFEYDYPHAYVELQFRWVHEWHGDPHAREGQRLGFFDPGGELPQPLLPAAVPALRWLRLPRTVFVTGMRRSPALAAAGAVSPRSLLLAAGPGAQSVADADGVVLDTVTIAETGRPDGGVLGAWVGSDAEVQLARKSGCDLVLVRSASLVESLLTRSAPLPAYLPRLDVPVGEVPSGHWLAHGCWIDLRPAD